MNRITHAINLIIKNIFGKVCFVRVFAYGLVPAQGVNYFGDEDCDCGCEEDEKECDCDDCK